MGIKFTCLTLFISVITLQSLQEETFLSDFEKMSVFSHKPPSAWLHHSSKDASSTLHYYKCYPGSLACLTRRSPPPQIGQAQSDCGTSLGIKSLDSETQESSMISIEPSSCNHFLSSVDVLGLCQCRMYRVPFEHAGRTKYTLLHVLNTSDVNTRDSCQQAHNWLKWTPELLKFFESSDVTAKALSSCFTQDLSIVSYESLELDVASVLSRVPLSQRFRLLSTIVDILVYYQHKSLILCDPRPTMFAFSHLEQRFKILDVSAVVYLHQRQPLLSHFRCEHNEQCAEVAAHCFTFLKRDEASELLCNSTSAHCNGIDHRSTVYLLFGHVLHPLLHDSLVSLETLSEHNFVAAGSEAKNALRVEIVTLSHRILTQYLALASKGTDFSPLNPPTFQEIHSVLRKLQLLSEELESAVQQYNRYDIAELQTYNFAHAMRLTLHAADPLLSLLPPQFKSSANHSCLVQSSNGTTLPEFFTTLQADWTPVALTYTRYPLNCTTWSWPKRVRDLGYGRTRIAYEAVHRGRHFAVKVLRPDRFLEQENVTARHDRLRKLHPGASGRLENATQINAENKQVTKYETILMDSLPVWMNAPALVGSCINQSQLVYGLGVELLVPFQDLCENRSYTWQDRARMAASGFDVIQVWANFRDHTGGSLPWWSSDLKESNWGAEVDERGNLVSLKYLDLTTMTLRLCEDLTRPDGSFVYPRVYVNCSSHSSSCVTRWHHRDPTFPRLLDFQCTDDAQCPIVDHRALSAAYAHWVARPLLSGCGLAPLQDGPIDARLKGLMNSFVRPSAGQRVVMAKAASELRSYAETLQSTFVDDLGWLLIDNSRDALDRPSDRWLREICPQMVLGSGAQRTKCCDDPSRSVHSSRWAYVWLLTGHEYGESAYLGYVANCILSARRLREFNSSADFVLIVTKFLSISPSLPVDVEKLLAREKIRIWYTSVVAPLSNRMGFAYQAYFSKLFVWRLTMYERVQFLDGDLLPTASLDDFFEWPAAFLGSCSLEAPLMTSWFVASPSCAAADLMEELATERLRTVFEHGKNPSAGFNETTGWGVSLSTATAWHSCAHEGVQWTFGNAAAEQGLIWYYVSFAQQFGHADFLLPNGIIERRSAATKKVEQLSWSSVTGASRIERHVSRGVPRPYAVLAKNTLHFAGNSKGWLRDPEVGNGRPVTQSDVEQWRDSFDALNLMLHKERFDTKKLFRAHIPKQALLVGLCRKYPDRKNCQAQ